jgi:hypothetical protein
VDNANDILDELRQLSPLVSTISRIAPYQVPAGYFNSLSDKVLARAQALHTAPSGAEETAVSSALLDRIGKQSPYGIPAHYFENFARQVLDRIHREQGNTGELTASQELEQLSPLLSSLRKSSPFQAPASYFEDLSGTVVSGVRAIEFVNDELENLSPLMAGLKNKATYQAPAAYFDQFAAGILAKVQQNENQPLGVIEQVRPATIATIPSSATSRTRIISLSARWAWKYSAAAIVTGLVLMAGWFSLSRPAGKTGNPADISRNIARVSDQDIQNYLDNQNIPLADATNNSTASLDMNDSNLSDFKSMLGDVPDDELKSYVDEHGASRELATN